MPSTLALNRRHTLALTLALLSGSAAAQTAATHGAAQGGTYPEKAITWLVGYPPGGTVDAATRLVARKVEGLLGATIVVENRAGATGLLALQAAARAAPDGHTLITVPGPVVTGKPMPQIGRELTGVALLGKGPMVLVGTTAQPMPGTLKELITAARAQPGKYSYVSSGLGTSQHLAGELLNQMAAIDLTHVPYKGGAQAVTDVIGGQVGLGMLGATSVLPHIASGKLKPYAVSTATRVKSLPAVPTLAEAGVPGFEASQWFAVGAPAGTPPERLHKLSAAIGEVLQQPDIVAAYAKIGLDAAVASAAQATAFVQADQKRWTELVHKARLELD